MTRRVYLFFGDRPDSFRAPFCDCTETCPECFAEYRTLGRLSDAEREERLARMEYRLGRSDDEVSE